MYRTLRVTSTWGNNVTTDFRRRLFCCLLAMPLGGCSKLLRCPPRKVQASILRHLASSLCNVTLWSKCWEESSDWCPSTVRLLLLCFFFRTNLAELWLFSTPVYRRLLSRRTSS